MNITPAILPHSFEEIQEKLSRVENSAHKIQIDICDGVMGREKTWLPEGTETLPAGFQYEFDIMLHDWKLYTMHTISIGATSIVAHVDQFSEEDMDTIISMVAPRNVALGISVSNDTSLDFHAEMIRKAKAAYGNVFIQVMGIPSIGEQGQVFDNGCLERVRMLKQQFGDVIIQVDGGMVPETAQLVINAGAETLVVGSYIFGGEDADGAISRLEALREEAAC